LLLGLADRSDRIEDAAVASGGQQPDPGGGRTAHPVDMA
jgi:hypothetical protein